MSDQIKSIFHEARSLRGDKRQAYLKAACGEDPDILARVQRLLALEDEVGDFLRSAAPDPDATIDESDDQQSVLDETPSQMIGPYKLLQPIGEGGFGVVYMAEQEKPVRRRVALKVIKTGMDTKAVIARFEAERQALAMMDHPNIAKVFDAGATDNGRPYFVMELIKGIPITDYCDQAELDTKQRLMIFREVCLAIQHAHMKGIIHRDIKPSNILVTLHDDKPIVKVIDFGIAKATEQRLTEKTIFTNFGQMIGTPAYMSPEQAVISDLDVDTRSDVYSLGVLLYELLTGTMPFDLKALRSAGYDEMRRIIREEQPPRPSTRLSTLEEGSKLAIAGKRHATPHALSKQLHGDLDLIIMKSLEKDRTRRYESASAFASDILRHLNDEPIEAVAPSLGYRMRRFARRNKGPIIVTATIASLLIVGTVVSTILAINAVAAREISERETKRANELRFASDVSRYASQIQLSDANYSKVNDSEARAILDQTDPSLRGWEYQRLSAVWNARRRMIDGDHSYDCVAMSPNGTLIAAGAEGAIVRLFDFNSAQPAGEFPIEGSSITSIKFSESGKHLGAASDRAVHIWDIQSRQEVGRVALEAQKLPYAHEVLGGPFEERAQTTLISLDQQDRYVAVTVRGGVQIWNRSLSEKVREISTRAEADKYDSICDIGFDPAGTRVLVMRHVMPKDRDQVRQAADIEFQMFDAASGKLAWSSRSSPSGLILGATGSFRFDNSGKWFLSGSMESRPGIVIRDAETGQVRHNVNTGLIANYILDASRDGRMAAVADSNSVNVFDLATGSLSHRLIPPFPRSDLRARRPSDPVSIARSIATSFDGQRIVTAYSKPPVASGLDKQPYHKGLVAWDLSGMTANDTLVKGSESYNPFSSSESYGDPFIAPDAEWFARLVIKVSKPAVGAGPATTPPAITKTSFVEFRSTRTGEQLYQLAESTDGPYVPNNMLAFSDDGRFMAMPDGKTIVVWRISDRMPSATLELPSGSVSDLQLSPDGRYLAATAAIAASRVASPGGNLDSAQGYNEFMLWDLSDKKLLIHEKEVLAPGKPATRWAGMDFDPNGDYLLLRRHILTQEQGKSFASASASASASLVDQLDCRTGKRMKSTELPYPVYKFCISKSSNRVYYCASGLDLSNDEGIWCWDLATDKRVRVYGGTFTALRLSPSEDRLLLMELNGGMEQRSLVLLETTTFQKVFQMPPAIGDCRFTPKGGVLRFHRNGKVESLLAQKHQAKS